MKKDISTWKLFVRTIRVMGKRAPLYLISIVMMSALFAMFGVFSALLMKSVVDIAPTGDLHRLIITILVIVVGGALSLVFYRFFAICYNVEAKRVYGVIYQKVLDLEMKLPYAYYEKHHSGEIMSKVSFDLGRMGDIYGSRLRRTVTPFLQVVVYLVPMFALSWQLTLCLAAVNSVMLMVNMLLVEPMRRANRSLSEINSNMTQRLSDLLQGMEQARMYRAGAQTVQSYLKENDTYVIKSKRRNFFSACLESSSSGFELLCALVFLLIGVSFVQQGYTTLGALAAIYTLYGSFNVQFMELGKYFPQLIAYLSYAQNIFDFLEEEREPERMRELADGGNSDKAVSMRNIDFSYDSADELLLNHFCMDIENGECVAITGASGCGKTTVSKLLLGLYPIQNGSICIAGKSMSEVTRREWRQRIAYVPQEPFLFNGSIRENIRMGRLDASDEEIEEAAKLANAHEFILTLENGYDTAVGERGNRLSGGQRQRIAIARAILKQAPIMLLDEATSALDNESEQLVNDAMKKLQRQMTIIMIAHRPSTIALADRVVEM
ncbi:MAG: ABC transporter ATP-binding protein/permease [Lachnospiraceae bacterium]|nr:ABC transporter ATP-binding protein/permease [Lachnospiraceae bacterium]